MRSWLKVGWSRDWRNLNYQPVCSDTYRTEYKCSDLNLMAYSGTCRDEDTAAIFHREFHSLVHGWQIGHR